MGADVYSHSELQRFCAPRDPVKFFAHKLRPEP